MVCMVFSYTMHAQVVVGTVVDSTNGKPLSYAGIIYARGAAVTYSDAEGVFYISKDSLFANDSLLIEYLGFNDLHVATSKVKTGTVFKMTPRMALLTPVVVSNCANMENVQVNKVRGRIQHYLGPGPETKFVLISRIDNKEKKSGYITQLSIYTESSVSEIRMPIRIRWYEWNEASGAPGKELTSTEILVTPYQVGWNRFDIPEGVIYCAETHCVLGLEFIYPASYVNSYQQIKTDKQKVQWLANMKNRWSLGTILSKNYSERSFYIINNLPMQPYVKKTEKFYVKPAVTVTVKTCAR